MTVPRWGTTRVVFGLSLVVLCTHLSRGWSAEPPDLTVLIRAFAVVEGYVVWYGTHAHEDAAFAEEFWRTQGAAQRQGVLFPILIWLPGRAGALRLTDLDPATRTLLCTSDMPLGPSAQRFLTALGCVVPRV